MSKKPYIHKRIFAYILDILVISIVSTILVIPFSSDDEYQELSKELYEITDKYKNEEIKEEVYLEVVNEINYKLTKINMPQTIVIIVVSILYYVLFNYYNKGQTIGKKLMKLRIINNNGNDLSINNYIIRMLVINPALSNLVNIILILTLSKEKYLIYESKFSTVFGVLYLLCFIFALYRSDGRGVHDLLASTIVVNDKEEILGKNEIKEAEIVSKKNKMNKDKEVK